MLEIRLVEEEIEVKDVTYFIDESKVDKEDLDKIIKMLKSGNLSKEQLNEVFLFCNRECYDTDVSDNDNEHEYRPSEYVSYNIK